MPRFRVGIGSSARVGVVRPEFCARRRSESNFLVARQLVVVRFEPRSHRFRVKSQFPRTRWSVKRDPPIAHPFVHRPCFHATEHRDVSHRPENTCCCFCLLHIYSPFSSILPTSAFCWRWLV